MNHSEPYLVYVIEADHAVKIGVSRAAAFNRERRKVIETAGGQRVTVIRLFPVDCATEAVSVEGAAHLALADSRTIGEWFHCHPLEAAAVVHRAWVDAGYWRPILGYWAPLLEAREAACR